MGKVIYSYAELESTYYQFKNLIDRERKLHEMDMMINPEHLDLLEYEIMPLMEEIVFYDPTPWIHNYHAWQKTSMIVLSNHNQLLY